MRPTGPEGRVTKGDILAYLESLGAAPTSTVSEEVAEAVPTTAEQVGGAQDCVVLGTGGCGAGDEGLAGPTRPLEM